MPYNGSGSWIPPTGQPVSPNTSISSSVFNNLDTDIGNTFNNTLPRDGQASLSAPLKLIDGLISTPSITFNGESSSGLWRPGTGSVSMTVLGSEVMRWTGSGVTIAGTLGVTGASTFGSTLGVTGAATFASTLSVAGASTMAGAVTLAAGGTSNGQFNLSGNNKAVFGPNSGWNQYLYVGGNGTNAGAAYGQIAVSDGNMHIDAGANKVLYLNYHGGNLINFCNGMQGVVASVNSSGGIGASSFNGPGTGLTGYAGGLNIGGTASYTFNHKQAGSGGNANALFNANDVGSSTWLEVNGGTNLPNAGWWFVKNYRHSNSGNSWGVQHALGWEDNGSEFYTRRVSAGVFSGWQRYLHDGIIGQYAPSMTGVGAYGTWGINITGNASGNAGTLTHSPNRSDGGAYPILWGTPNATTQAYSCAATTITSSTGVINANGINAQLTGLALSTSNTFTASQNFTSTSSVGNGAGLGALTAYAATGSGSAAFMGFHRAGSYAINFGLDTDNVVRMGGWSDGTNVYRMQLDASGNAVFNGNVTAYSDAKLKKDIRVIPDALKKVEQVRGVLFNRIKDDVAGTGVIAQELQKVLPEAVQADAEGTLSVAYGNVVGLLIEAVKELNAKVKTLEDAAK